MSADKPGLTTYAAGFGPRSGTVRKPDPYAMSPRPPRSPRATPTLPPAVDPAKLAFSITEQYKLKKYRDDYADQVMRDVEAYRKEEEERQWSARRQRELYNVSLKDQIEKRSASRDAARKKELEEKATINKDFELYVQETLRQKEHQRQKHQEYLKEIQQQHSEMAALKNKLHSEDSAVADMINKDALQKKQEDEERAANRRRQQAALAQEMMKEHAIRSANKEAAKQRAATEDKQYLNFVDTKAAQEEQIRSNHIKTHQKILPYIIQPRPATPKETVPDYLSILAEERRTLALQKSEHNREMRETLQRQINERSARKEAERQRNILERQRAEEDARRYEEEQRLARTQHRAAAMENERGVANQITDSIRRQYRLDEEEWKTLSISGTNSCRK